MTRYTVDSANCRNYELACRKEWLLTNGIGGYAMGTVAGTNSRRYHGHLVAATNPPTERTVLLASVEAHIQGEGNPIGLSSNAYAGAIFPEGYRYLEEFHVNDIAYWRYRAGGMVMEKQIAMQPGENTSTIRYSNGGTKPFRLILNPLVCNKFYHATFQHIDPFPDSLEYLPDRTLIRHQGHTLTLIHAGAVAVPSAGWYYRFEHFRDDERGLHARNDLFCAVELQYELQPGEAITLGASSESHPNLKTNWEVAQPKSSTLGDSLRSAVQKVLIESPQRSSIIAGYPWFTDWGRDTMIALPGVCLHTGRIDVARKIILAYGNQMHQGLIPNRFVDSGEDAEYNTVDATLWFANAIHRTLQAEWDIEFAESCFEFLAQMIAWHHKGTLYSIKVDPRDGLLSQGEAGVQLTWMDAKVGDWVVTPRHGKPVEINGLWVNALRVIEWIGNQLGLKVDHFSEAAHLAERSFDAKFFRASLGYYLDTADPDDASLRPNQVIAMSVPFSPCEPAHAVQALDKVREHLLTPVGLRTLSPDSNDYRGQFKGDLPKLDEAYHQGTVWPWLMGPYITALVKLTGNSNEARALLSSGRSMLDEYGLGGIAEVYDGSEPRDPGGCPWQAWSAAEWLRAWEEDAGGD